MPVTLSRGRLWTHPLQGGGLELELRGGHVWLTRDGDPEDKVLGPGDRYAGEGEGTVVVQALDEARFSVSPRGGPGHSGEGKRRTLWLALALAAVYLVWGSTYLAMRVAMESFSPMTMGGVRFLAAGAVLYSFLRLRGTPSPTSEQWLSAAKVGVLLLVCGNGFVALAQQWIGTGLAAIVVATMPLWAALVARMWGERPSRIEWVGLILGLAGIALLKAGGEITARSPAGLVILLAPIAWAVGSMWSRRLPLPPSPLMTAAAQMLVGGAVMLVVGGLLGERLPAEPSARSLVAIAYLAAFGSIVAFSAYGWLLRNARPSVATSYAYVNPVIAVALGAVFANEAVTPLTWVAGLVISSAVLLVTRARSAVAAPTTARR